MKAVCKRVALYGLTVAAFSCSDQPKPNCLTSQNPWVLKLIEQTSKRKESIPGACDAAGAGLESFYADPVVGLSPYYERDKKGQPDYSKGSVAIRTAELATFVSTAEEHLPEAMADLIPETNVLHSLGKFTGKEPDSRDYCSAPVLSDTRVVLPEVPPDPAEEFPGQRAYNITRKWSNLNIYVTADSYGTQMEATMLDEWVAPNGAGTCTIEYRALGLSPAVSCQVLDEDDHPMQNPDKTFVVDPTLCDPEAHPEKDRFVGSGIGPSAKTVCDAKVGYCMIDGTTFPALK